MKSPASSVHSPSLHISSSNKIPDLGIHSREEALARNPPFGFAGHVVLFNSRAAIVNDFAMLIRVNGLGQVSKDAVGLRDIVEIIGQ